MNKAYILHHLKEAHEHLARVIEEIESQADYDYGEYVVDVSHLYHHINTAWNAREASEAEAEKCTEANFKRWRQMPNSSELHLES